MFDIKWKNCGLLGAGILLGSYGLRILTSYGLRILTSRDAKKAYTHGTAAVFRMKDEVLKDVSLIRENCGDIAAEAKELNEKRQAMDEAQQIEDAKAILAAANESAE